ncbi:MAG: DNA topoisomerase VI subunit B [Planctomycetota bacterium]
MSDRDPRPKQARTARKKSAKVAKKQAAAPKGKSGKSARGRAADDDGAQLSLFEEAPAPPTPTRGRKRGGDAPGTRSTAEKMAARQKDISVSEFFAKNRHLLGFDSPARSLLTTVREAVDNSLDACEEAGIAPEISVELIQKKENRYRVVIQDNGPGIVKAQLAKIFGRLLYGSKFHARKQTRGQQGIGISAAGMYGTLTTGQPMRVTSRTSARKPALQLDLAIDMAKNIPVVKREQEVEVEWKHGTIVEIELEATYKKGKHSVDAYLEQVSLANPHVRIEYRNPTDNEPIVYDRVTRELPAEPKEILPHPHGVELGILMRMMKETPSRTLSGFLCTEFSRMTPNAVEKVVETSAGLSKKPLSASKNPKRFTGPEVELLHRSIAETALMAPPTNCLSPIGEELIGKTLGRNFEVDQIISVTRSPAVYRGNPFQIEVGLAYGGDLPADELATVYRFANRVPLQYEAGACAIQQAVVSVPWRNYEVQQARGALPTGPIAVMVHIASVWVPYTSESKKAVAHYDEILKEIRLALMEVGRKLAVLLRRRRREADAARKRDYIKSYIPEIGIALREILDLSDPQVDKAMASLTDVLERSRKL